MHVHKQPYPHPEKKIRLLDGLVMVNAVAMPFTTLPQITKIFQFKDAAAISIWMWVLYTLSCLIMLVYGVVHKVKWLIVLNVLWLAANSLVIFGIILYG